MRVAVTGATGFIGRAIVRALQDRGDSIVALTRHAESARRVLGEIVQVVPWTPDYDASWGNKLAGCVAVINLAGEPIFGRRWTQAQKQRIRESRTRAVAGIIEAIRRLDRPPAILINASAIGYYGPHGDEALNEASAAGNDFLAEVCRAWEQEVETAKVDHLRTVRIRTGIVLGADGGALKRMVPLFKMFLGGLLGSGQQWMSWIHLEDLVRMYLWALDNPQVEGPLNGTAPNPVTNREFSRTLGRTLGRPAWLPAPAFAVRRAFGEAANVILQGQRVLPVRSLEWGFTFQFPMLKEALEDILYPPR